MPQDRGQGQDATSPLIQAHQAGLDDLPDGGRKHQLGIVHGGFIILGGPLTFLIDVKDTFLEEVLQDGHDEEGIALRLPVDALAEEPAPGRGVRHLGNEFGHCFHRQGL